jgi:DNA polymerase III alpha subunit (gram-positive type)
MDITDVLAKFHEKYKKCDIIVAHNIGFDKEMINIELSRNQHRLNPEITGFRMINAVYSVRKYCTAQCTTEDLFATLHLVIPPQTEPKKLK